MTGTPHIAAMLDVIGMRRPSSAGFGLYHRVAEPISVPYSLRIAPRESSFSFSFTPPEVSRTSTGFSSIDISTHA